MNTKLTVALLAGVSICLSISAYAFADGEPSEDVNWSYVMATEPVDTIGAKSNTGVQNVRATDMRRQERSENGSETVIAKTVREGRGDALTLTYVDEAAPIPGNTTAPRAFKKCKGTCLSDPIPVQELEPQTVARNSVVESQIDTQYVQQPVKVQYPITRQYPISVQYPVTVQREITIEQPVVMQQPVIVKRPVVMQQAITVQRRPAYVQQQPMVMQQQPTYIQQQPIVMQAPMGQPAVIPAPQQPMPMTQQPVYQGVPPANTQPMTISAPVYSAPIQTRGQTQMMSSRVSMAASTQAYVPQQQVVRPVQAPQAVQPSVAGQAYVPVQGGQPVYQQPAQPQIGYGYQAY